MKIRIISTGKIKDARLSSLAKEYSGKIGYDARIEITEIKDSDPEKEWEKISAQIENLKEDRFVFALSEEGKQLGSAEFSLLLKKISLENKLAVFVIGGPYGLSPEAKKSADFLISLSKMTFTHEMAGVLLLEQLYRAISIIKNKKYHKAD